MKNRRPQLFSEQNERGRRIDREEVKVISQESYLKVICEVIGRRGESKRQVPSVFPYTARSPPHTSRFHSGPHRAFKLLILASRLAVTQKGLWISSCSCLWLKTSTPCQVTAIQLYLVWAFCDLLSVKVISPCDSYVDEAKRWISQVQLCQPICT